MTIMVGRASQHPRKAVYYLANEGRNASRRVLAVRGISLDRDKFASSNKAELRVEAAFVACQLELAIELVPANRKARRKSESIEEKKKLRNTCYNASLNPPAGFIVTALDFERGKYFLEDTVFRRYDGSKRGPVQQPAIAILLEHTKPTGIRNEKHGHYTAGLFTITGTVIPIYYDAINTAVAAARWAHDRCWPATCSHYTVAVEHRVRAHYPEAHAAVVESMIRRAEQGQRVGAIPVDRDIRAMEPADLAALIERRFGPRRDDANIEERISLYRLLDTVPANQTVTVLADAGYRLGIGDSQTKCGNPIYLVQPVERDESGKRRAGIGLHRIARAGLQADGMYGALGDKVSAWVDGRTIGLGLRSIHEVRREIDDAANKFLGSSFDIRQAESVETTASASATALPVFRIAHLAALEAAVRQMAEADTLPSQRITLVTTLTSDWNSVRRANPDASIEEGRRAIREGVGVALVALIREDASAAPADSPIRVLAEDALEEVSSSARVSRARFGADAVHAYLAGRTGLLSVEDACRAAGPVERERAAPGEMAEALRRASQAKFAIEIARLVQEPIDDWVPTDAPGSPLALPGTGVSASEPEEAAPPSTPILPPPADAVGINHGSHEPPGQVTPSLSADNDNATIASDESRREELGGGLAHESEPVLALPPNGTTSHDQSRPEDSKVKRDAAVLALIERDDEAQKRTKKRPTKKALRLRPDITIVERQAVRQMLIDAALDVKSESRPRTPTAASLNEKKRLSGLRTIIGHTQAASEKATNPVEKLALKVGLETAQEAYRIVSAGSGRPGVERQIRIDDTIRGLADNAKTVRMLAAKLALELPKLRGKISGAAKDKGSSEDMIAIDGGRALAKLRESNATANQTAHSLEAALKNLEQAHKSAKAVGIKSGGFEIDHRLTLHGIRHRTALAVAWIPPLPNDKRTIRRRVEDALDGSRLPLPPKPLGKPDIKKQVKWGNDWNDQQNQIKEQRRQKVAAAKRAEAPATVVSNKPKTPHSPTPSVRS
ncbi:hypothetical protein ACLF3G_27210 [Falsiroseomonas sp. HC035]|uniref:hypothetical protein n=1 Tax=Falsiroseomonas sp. HC035 TaxID=3390999 RepID=UPI003D31BDD0